MSSQEEGGGGRGGAVAHLLHPPLRDPPLKQYSGEPEKHSSKPIFILITDRRGKELLLCSPESRCSLGGIPLALPSTRVRSFLGSPTTMFILSCFNS